MTENPTPKHAKLLFNFASRSGSIAVGTYLQVIEIDSGFIKFKTPDGTDRVTQEFCVFEDPPAGVIPYASDEPIR
jgi:hypothetical protein